MWWHVFSLELRQRFTSWQTWIYFALIAFFASGSIGDPAAAVGRRLLNGSYHLADSALAFSSFGVLITAGYVGQALFRDFRTGIYPLVYTSGLSPAAYLGGRFLGALTANAFILLGWGLGVVVTSLLPFGDPSALGPFVAANYLRPYLIFLLPNLLFTGAIFFALPALTRKILPNYVAGIVLLVGYLLSSSVGVDSDSRLLTTLLDPFGMQAFAQQTRYWTIADQNTLAVGLDGYLLYNRLLWVAIGMAVLALLFARFRFQHAQEPKGGHHDPALEPLGPQAALEPPPFIQPIALAARLPSFTARSSWRQYLIMSKTAFVSSVRNVYFAAIVTAGLIFLVVSSTSLAEMRGTTIYPVTHRVVSWLSADFFLFMLIVITYYSGELVWRDRNCRVEQVHDALPVRNWIAYASKFTALGMIMILLLLVIMAHGLVMQTLSGYHNYELGVYISELFGIQLIDLLLLSGLALFVQVVVNRQYLGYVLVVGFYLALNMAGGFGVEHNLLLFARDSGIVYSDMNGYGPYAGPFIWFKAYWSALGVFLAFVTTLFWVRGEDRGWRSRWALARRRMSGRVVAGMTMALAAFLLCGGFILYNTNVINTFLNRETREHRRAEYERKYKEHERFPLPAIVDMRVEVDLYPERGSAAGRGTYTLLNQGSEPIEYLVVKYRSGVVDLRMLEFDRRTEQVLHDESFGHTLHRFAEPLQPADTVFVSFAVEYERPGFTNETDRTEIVRNGTFIHHDRLFPTLGYDRARELTRSDVRSRFDLPSRKRPAVDDSAARMRNELGLTSWTTFEAVVSTPLDQVAIAPGTLVEEWEEDGRHHFRYSTRGQRMLPFVSYLSADYEVARDRWRNVDLEVYYHRSHGYNLDRFMNGMKKALTYNAETLGPYQFDVARIVVVPRYQATAQAFPSTIPYSEDVGFIARVDESAPDGIDYPFLNTAHEIAHQWWAHQVIGGDVQGSAMLTESLAGYSALRVLEREYGPDKMRRFLEGQLDGYLSGRRHERDRESPLLWVERGQGYIYYYKGALVFYALGDYIGHDRLEGALREFLEAQAFQPAPFASSLDLYDYLQAATPDSLRYYLEDAFENITLYDLRASRAIATEMEGRFWITLDIDARKLRADDQGAESRVRINDWIDIGVFEDRQLLRPLYLHKHRISDETQSVTIVVDREPSRAGIDPYHKLIDRDASDNVVRVTRAVDLGGS